MGDARLSRHGRGLALDGQPVADGDELEVCWHGRWVRGRVVYCYWRFAHRLNLGVGVIDLVTGMAARKTGGPGENLLSQAISP